MCCDSWPRELLYDYSPTKPWHHDPASDAQLRALERRGFDPPYGLTKGEASWVMDRPTPKQRKVLERRGLYDPDMTFAAACEALDRLAQAEGW
jgi:hypothetical protein